MEAEVEQSDIMSTPASPDQSECNDADSNSNVASEKADDANTNENTCENTLQHQVNGDYTDTNTQSPSDDNCLVHLIFKDEATFDEFHPIIGKCVRDALFELKKPANVIVNRTQNSIKIVEISSNENDESIFMVDTLPTDNTNEAEIPDYNSSAIGVLNDETPDPKETDANDECKPKTGNCWNCAGDHNMKDCTAKRDPAAIRKAREQFAMQKSRGVERYHLDSEQKYSHLVPGKISDSLRDALGLRKREVPLYLYKMRLYGYPQGWLEEAKINNSGLSLIHSENKATIDKDADGGEVDKVTFDATKFIDYPGFNAPLPSNLIDEGDYHGVPPMQFCNTKEGLTQMLQDNLAKTYKRKRLKLDASAEPTPKESVNDEDMDVQNSDGDSNEAPVLFPQPRPSAGTDESNSMLEPGDGLEVSGDSTQLSLLELKRKQEEILKALEDASSDSNATPTDQNDVPPPNDPELDVNATPTPISHEDNATDVEQSALDTTMETGECVASIKQMESVQNTPTSSTAGHSRLAMSGTPLIQQVSPFSKLPVGDKWSVGVTDVIDFENLPDATGAYRKLTDVISKVRTTIKRMHDETENDSS